MRCGRLSGHTSRPSNDRDHWDSNAAVSESAAAGAEGLSASTEEQTAGVQEIAAGAQELAVLASGLEELVRRFRTEAPENARNP